MKAKYLFVLSALYSLGISQEITNIDPNQSYPSIWNLQVELTGENTNWYDPYTIPTVSFSGSGIDVDSVYVLSDESLHIQIDIQSSANAGQRDVTVALGGESVSLEGGFEILTPEIISLTPSAAMQGENNIEVTLVAAGVDFYDPYSIEDIYFSGEGLSTSNYQVTSDNTVNFDLNVSSDAPIGSRDVYLTGNFYELTKTDAFTVNENPYTTIEVAYSEGWNIVGLAVDVDDNSYENLFPNAQSGTLYSFDGIYQGQEMLEPGNGYLIRLNMGGDVSFLGYQMYDLSIALSTGWNLFSGLSLPVSSDVVYGHEFIQNGTIYGLDGIYFSAETIEPGMGYWVRANSEGELNISSDGLARSVPFVNRMEEANSITFSANGLSIPLYFGLDVPEEERMSYSLPPKLPQMVFDVRFSGDMKYVAEYGEVSVVSQSDQLTVFYDVEIPAGEEMNWLLTTESGSEYILDGSSEIVIPSEEKFYLSRQQEIPETFTLHQNFPNPFNPVTMISYDLPKDSDVRMTIYDMLGNEITTLVNGAQQAGSRSVHWDATDSMGRAVSAGLYLYNIEAGEFVQTRKMVLLK
tara:strand:+ start:14952 stop:16682 length:1731 start_codon:yes stop_codon:yes gene_type:complete